MSLIDIFGLATVMVVTVLALWKLSEFVRSGDDICKAESPVKKPTRAGKKQKPEKEEG